MKLNIKNFKDTIWEGLSFIFIFLVSLYKPFDSDLGWHLKYGEYFFQHLAPLRVNTFSTEMPGFPWINSSWGTDLISYLAYHYFGFVGLSVLAAGVISLTLWFFAKAFKMDFFAKALTFPIILYFLYPINIVSFRGQLLSLMFLGVLLFLTRLFLDSGSKKFFLLIPALFMVWSNVHGEFLLGLGILAVWSASVVALKLWDKRFRLDKEVILLVRNLAIIGVLSALAIMINPFGLSVYFEAFKHFGNPLQQYIAEWLPFEELSGYWWSQMIVGIVIFTGIIFMVFSNQFKKNFPYIIIVSIFFMLTFFVRRYAWPMYYLSIPFIAAVVVILKPESKKYSRIFGTVFLVIALSTVFVLDNPFNRIKNMSWKNYCNSVVNCSPAALDFMVRQNYKGKIYTFYDWGGWMIWNYPEVMPSVDGRMHLWRDETGYSAFENYYVYEQAEGNIDDSKHDVVLITTKKPLYIQLENLAAQKKWRKVYEDKRAAVFVRSENAN